jgi:hypothetical protein
MILGQAIHQLRGALRPLECPQTILIGTEPTAQDGVVTHSVTVSSH